MEEEGDDSEHEDAFDKRFRSPEKKNTTFYYPLKSGDAPKLRKSVTHTAIAAGTANQKFNNDRVPFERLMLMSQRDQERHASKYISEADLLLVAETIDQGMREAGELGQIQPK